MGRFGVGVTALGRFLERVHRQLPPARAILFGSRARGTALEDSDYDLILVPPAFAPLDFAERLRRVQAAWELPEPLEALCYTPEEFDAQRRGVTTVGEAVREGRDLPLPAAGRGDGETG